MFTHDKYDQIWSYLGPYNVPTSVLQPSYYLVIDCSSEMDQIRVGQIGYSTCFSGYAIWYDQVWYLLRYFSYHLFYYTLYKVASPPYQGEYTQ